MKPRDWNFTNTARPILIRIAHKRDEPGTAADTDLVISRGPYDYALHEQRLDNGGTYAGQYSEDLQKLLDKALAYSNALKTLTPETQ